MGLTGFYKAQGTLDYKSNRYANYFYYALRTVWKRYGVELFITNQ